MKIKHLAPVAFMAVVAFTTSCKKDFLDTNIDIYHTPETVAQNYGTLFDFGYAMYAFMPYGFTELDGNLFAPASDEAYQTITTATTVRFYNEGVLSPLNIGNTGNAYKNLYEGIRRANFFLDYSVDFAKFLTLNRDTTDNGKMLQLERDSLDVAWLRAEAHIVRAFYYSELLKRYGGVPLITTTMDKSEERNVPRAGYDEVVNYIVNEIDTYKDSLAVNWKNSQFKANDGRFSKMSALALKSRVLLYAASPRDNATNDVEKWKKAAEAAKDLINKPEFNLNLFGDYTNLFREANPIQSTNPEVILAVRRPPSNGFAVNNYPIATPGGKSGVVPSHNLVKSYEYTGTPNPANPYANRDPRLGATVVTNMNNWNGRDIKMGPGESDDMTRQNASKTGYYLRKFLTYNLNLQQGATIQFNWIIYRYAETLLNYAEAMNEAYGPDAVPSGYPMSARAALKRVRDRASTSLPAVTVTSVEEFRERVKHERRVELAFENHRYWDLLRWKDAEVVLNQPLLGVQVSKSGTNTYTYTEVEVDERKFNAPAMYYFPFSRTEIANSNGNLVQNPEY